MSAPERRNRREGTCLDSTLETARRTDSEHARNATQEFHQVRVAPSDIEVLRAQVRQIEERRRRLTTGLQFGLAEIDARLPAGGLTLGALHEVAGGGNGAIDGAPAALFVAGIAAWT